MQDSLQPLINSPNTKFNRHFLPSLWPQLWSLAKVIWTRDLYCSAACFEVDGRFDSSAYSVMCQEMHSCNFKPSLEKSVT